MLGILWDCYISIHVPLAGDDGGITNQDVAVTISIHVPLAGDDRRSLVS